jgi:flagellar biogenesis protein FliO
VLALVGGVFWLVRRWTPALRVADGHLMRVVARTSLSPKHHAALLQLGRRLVLVAVSPGGVETLCEITDPGEVGELTGRTARAMAPNPAGFDGQLNRELAEYREELHDDAGATPVSRSPRRPDYEPLTDLLHRLRALRAK